VDVKYVSSFGPVEFLDRELKWRYAGSVTNLVNEKKDIFLDDGVNVVLVGNSLLEIDEVKEITARNFLVYLYADETYKFKLSKGILGITNVQGIIRNYPLNRQVHVWEKINSSLTTLLVSLLLIDFSRFRLCVAGIVMSLRQSALIRLHSKSGKFSISAPLGYTNLFAETFREFVDSQVKPYESLFELKDTQEALLLSKNTDICFVGQKGNSERVKFIEKVLEESKKLDPDCLQEFKQRDSFGGVENSGTKKKWAKEYVETLARATINICPPGNYSGVTFRFAESLLLNCFPLESDYVLTDPHWKPYLLTESRVSWRHRLQGLIQLTAPKRSFEVAKMRESYLKALARFHETVKGC